MTDLERVEYMYNFIVPIVVDRRTVTVKTALFSVDFYRDDVYHIKTEDVNAESKTLYPLFELVKHSIKHTSLCDDIEVIVDGELFALIKK